MHDVRPPPELADYSFFDAYTPEQIARRVEKIAVVKAKLPTVPLLALSLLAGAFIAFGAMFYTAAITESSLGFGASRVLGGLVFCLGLILVVVGGAELFTGDVLMVIAWAGGKVGTAALLRIWGLVYLGNLLGGVAMAVLAHGSGLAQLGGGAVGATTVAIAEAKVALAFDVAFFKGVLCNALVCLAVWLTFGARGVADKILAILFPIAAFVALGFEHSIANMYFLPAGYLAAPAEKAQALGLVGFLKNMVPVTLGNVVGGGVFVALTYYIIYLRGRRRRRS
jgi:formate/nitrite transporter